MYEIRVFGDWEFIFDAYNAIARMTESGVLNYIAATAFILTFGWGFIKQMMDDKPNVHLKEMVLGIMMWIFLASPQGVKVDIQITSVNDPSVFAVVDDVPFLAAAPGWIATNALSSIREELERQFLPVSYTSGESTNDPLSAIMRIYNTPLPADINLGQVQASGGYNLNKTINNYVKECFIADHELDGSEPSSPISVMRKTTLDRNYFQSLRVDFNGIGTTVYLSQGGSEFGEFLSCPVAHDRIMNALQSGALQVGIEEYNEDRGITSAVVADGMAAIQGSYGTGPSAYDITLGLFTAYMVRDGLRNTAFETEIDQMIFQGQRTRMFEKAGEAKLFNQIAIPIVTALEAFSLFIYPIYVILMVIGSQGIKHVGKYFMLIVFVNLWGIMKVFVDFYTISSTEKAFTSVDNPFTFDGMPNTIVEIEGFLTIASSLNTAIPMFAMFLLFGGVHSMMGAMSKMTQGNVDSKYGAPNISSSMNNGNRDMADYSQEKSSTTGNSLSSYKVSTDASLGSAKISGQIQDAVGAQSSIAQSEVGQKSQAFNELYSRAVNNSDSRQIDSQYTSQDAASYSQSIKAVQSLSEKLQSIDGISANQADELATTISGGGGLGAMASGTGVGIKADQAESIRKAFGSQYSEIEDAVQQSANEFAESEQWSELRTSLESSGQSISQALNEGNSELYSSARNVVDARQEQVSAQEKADAVSGISRQIELPLNEVRSSSNIDAEQLYKKLTTDAGEGTAIGALMKQGYSQSEASQMVVDELGNIGVGNGQELADLASDRTVANGFKGTDLGAILKMSDNLAAAQKGEGATSQGVDSIIMGAAYNYVGDTFDKEFVGDGRTTSQGNQLREAGALLQNSGSSFVGKGGALDTGKGFIADTQGNTLTGKQINTLGENATKKQEAEIDNGSQRGTVQASQFQTRNTATENEFKQRGADTEGKIAEGKDALLDRGKNIQDGKVMTNTLDTAAGKASESLDYVANTVQAGGQAVDRVFGQTNEKPASVVNREKELTTTALQNDGNGFEVGNANATARQIETPSGDVYKRVGQTVGEDKEVTGTIYRDFTGDTFRFNGYGMKQYDATNTDVRLFKK